MPTARISRPHLRLGKPGPPRDCGGLFATRVQAQRSVLDAPSRGRRRGRSRRGGPIDNQETPDGHLHPADHQRSGARQHVRAGGLGYTMVYGIINLINFAHGEVLMVGALTSWTIVDRPGRFSGLPGWLLLLISLIAAIVVCARAQLRDREGRLPAAAQRAPAGAADHRDGHEPAAADAGDDHLEADHQALPDPAADRAVQHRRRGDQHRADPDPGASPRSRWPG